MLSDIPALLGGQSLIGFVGKMATTATHSNLDDYLTLALRTAFFGALTLFISSVGLWIRRWIERDLYPTAYIDSTDPSYLWIMAWIARDPAAQSQIKNFVLVTTSAGQVRAGTKNGLYSQFVTQSPLHAMKDLGPHSASWASTRVIGQVTPVEGQQIRIKHGQDTLWITRGGGAGIQGLGGRLTVHTMIWQRSALRDFLTSANARYFEKEERELLIYHSEHNHWLQPICRAARPCSSIILPERVKENLIADIEGFLSANEIAWYASRGIPHRRGYLLHGPPGSGKTTIATAIASKLALDIYVMNPSQFGMDDAALCKMFRACPAPSVILIEDIDCIFPPGTKDSSGRQVDDMVDDTMSEQAKALQSPAAGLLHSFRNGRPTVTLSGLLNAIDGVSSQEGCIVIATTNHPERLDPALRRSGRFDVDLPFHHATPEQARTLFQHFFPAAEHLDLGFADLVDSEASKASPSEHFQQLAIDFAEAIFPSQGVSATSALDEKDGTVVSMAALQGYLLGHKKEPLRAVRGARAWAEGLLAGKKSA